MTPGPHILIIDDDTLIVARVSAIIQKKRCGGIGEISPGKLIAKERPIRSTLKGNLTTPGNPVSAYNPDMRIAKGA